MLERTSALQHESQKLSEANSKLETLMHQVNEMNVYSILESVKEIISKHQTLEEA